MRQEVQELLSARSALCAAGRPALDARLADSWQRSVDAGLHPRDMREIPEPLTGSAFRQLLDCNGDLLAHARPVMDFVYGQIRGSQCMVVLSDAHSLLLHTQGDRTFLNKAQRVALMPGADWHERRRGTNAIGTAVADRAPVRVRGSEHFMEQNGFLHCSAAPIFTAQGDVAGVVDISGAPIASHRHTLALAGMAARMIENSWLKSSYPQHARIHLHPQPQGLDTPAEGIVIMSGDGVLVGANQAAMQLLRLASGDFFQLRLDSRLRERLLKLLAESNRGIRSLRLPGAGKLYLRIHYATAAPLWQRATDHRLSAAPHPTAAPVQASDSAPSGETAQDALAATDTGDQRWRTATDKVRRILRHDIPLLIQGESGVGKEVLARAAHASGPRQGKPFVAINCAAIPESLIEAELFGYAPGAYTGALRGGSPGRIREAHGGTLFLDEIGDMPLLLQSRLLRVLQQRQVTPLGGAPVQVDFALICASHCALAQAVEQGRFRADLYYRINGFAVHLPPLRERQDFDALIGRILRDCATEDLHVAPDVMAAMRRYHWPGNLRQLASVLKTACALREPHEQQLSWHHLADDISATLQSLPPAAPAVPAALPARTAQADDMAGALQRRKLAAIARAVQEAGGNISRAARALGVSRQTIYRHLRDAQWRHAGDVAASKLGPPHDGAC
ncbi:ATPase AAA [Lampropedia cohaerens]|uniref:ATPase AAA n=1 Tax=Lampropedia cohaerens TaxID=1610491 RepID=A0A0U1Q297_9BURK|nr:sigma-54-dependent Fis family transcriptional regulator [Lampropedia cohaerens]KKW68886.1 ATPase AAA [Lampropedia cohaerens]